MRIHHSHEADALYIRLNESDIESSDEISEDVIMDYDKDGKIVGIEILSASKKADMKNVIIQFFEKVMVEN